MDGAAEGWDIQQELAHDQQAVDEAEDSVPEDWVKGRSVYENGRETETRSDGRIERDRDREGGRQGGRET